MILQRALDEALHDKLYSAGAEWLADKLKEQGVTLTPRQFDQVKEHLRSSTSQTLRLKSWRWWASDEVSVTITAEEAEGFATDFQASLVRDVPRLVESLSDDLSLSILEALNQRWKKENRRQGREQRKFRKGINSIWGEAIGCLRQFLTISRELGANANSHLRTCHPEDQSSLIDVLTRLHARACQVTDEIVCLLEAGLSDGAMARWRTLHEIAAVAFLLRDHGEGLAERYVDHESVESWHAMQEYQQLSSDMGYEPYLRDEWQSTEAEYEKTIERYGPKFKTQYGWAAEALGIDRPGIRDIEQAAGVAHLHAYYRLASHNVHSNPKGIFFKLGLLEEFDVLLTGPSNFGLADPGHSAAISLTQVTTALLSVDPTLDLVTGLKILQRLTNDIGELFIEANRRFDTE